MSVPKSQRSEHKLHVHVELRRLANHTLTKTGNANKFGMQATYLIERDEYGNVTTVEERRASARSSLARRLEDAAIGALTCAWQANSIRVGPNGEGYDRRRALQDESVRHLDVLHELIGLTRETCGLTSKEVGYWAGQTSMTRMLVRKWRDGDARRYRRNVPGDEGL